jgi:hypothetical protein
VQNPCGRSHDELRRDRLDCVGSERVQGNALAAQFDLAAIDAADIQKIVNRPHHVLDLPFHPGSCCGGSQIVPMAFSDRANKILM